MPIRNEANNITLLPSCHSVACKLQFLKYCSVEDFCLHHSPASAISAIWVKMVTPPSINKSTPPSYWPLCPSSSCINYILQLSLLSILIVVCTTHFISSEKGSWPEMLPIHSFHNCCLSCWVSTALQDSSILLQVIMSPNIMSLFFLCVYFQFFYHSSDFLHQTWEGYLCPQT